MSLKKGKNESDELFVIRNLLERGAADVVMLKQNDNSAQAALAGLSKEVKTLKQEIVLLKSFVDKKLGR